MAENKIGRPLKYDPEIHPDEAERIASGGIIDAEIARRMGIAYSTLREWRDTYPEFSAALKRGHDKVDNEIVNSLYNRARGMFVTEEKRVDDGASVRIETAQKWICDTTAQIFWLTNRQKADWKRMQSTEVSGPNGDPISIVTTMSDEEVIANARRIIASRPGNTE